MKKFTAIFLLLQFLTNNSFAEEFIKLPKLFTHYYHHSHEHHDKRNFIDYLVLHYSGNHFKDEHRGEDGDCNLPFKHCNNCCMSAHAPVLAFIPSTGTIDFGFVTAITKSYTTENDKIFSISSTPVWQPPKFA